VHGPRAVSATWLLSAFMRANVSLGRIRDFLDNTEELDRTPRKLDAHAVAKDDHADVAISIAPDSTFRFSRYTPSSGFSLRLSDPKKKGTGLSFPRGQTTLVAGDVGSGKSALLLALLGELHVAQGSVEVFARDGGRVKTSFAAQSPWLQGASLLRASPRDLRRSLTLALARRHVGPQQHPLRRGVRRGALQRDDLCVLARGRPGGAA